MENMMITYEIYSLKKPTHPLCESVLHYVKKLPNIL